MAQYSVIGQSNSLMSQGFVARLLEFKRHVLRSSGRLGASPSVLAAYYADDAFLLGSEFCIIDVCVVDAATLHKGFYSLADSAAYLSWLGHTCRRNGCQPIFVLIPPLSMLRDSFTEELFFGPFESVIRDGAYFHLDLRKPLRALAARAGARPDAFYADPSHIGPELSSVAAEILASFLDHPGQAYRSVDTTYLGRSFQRVSLPDVAPRSVERASHATGLRSFEGIRLSAAASASLEIGSFQRLRAVMVNAAYAHRRVVFRGNSEIVKGLNLTPYNPNARLEARLVPITSVLGDRNRTIELEIAEPDAVPTEPTMQEGRTLDLSTPPSVELSELLVELRPDLRTYTAAVPPAAHTDLYAAFGADVMAR